MEMLLMRNFSLRQAALGARRTARDGRSWRERRPRSAVASLLPWFSNCSPSSLPIRHKTAEM